MCKEGQKMLTVTGRMTQLPPYSAFMFGSLDADSLIPESAVSLGEAILAARNGARATPAVSYIHRHDGLAAGGNGAFMFGVHPEQPVRAALDELAMDVLASEQT
jgi:hypothetical protein